MIIDLPSPLDGLVMAITAGYLIPSPRVSWVRRARKDSTTLCTSGVASTRPSSEPFAVSAFRFGTTPRIGRPRSSTTCSGYWTRRSTKRTWAMAPASERPRLNANPTSTIIRAVFCDG